MNYDYIHSCTTGCVLFKGTLKHSRACPKCNTSRFVENSQSIPRKHFPLIPQLLKMYMCKTLVELLIWRHKDGASIDGLIRGVSDSESWKHIIGKWSDFVVEQKNLIKVSTRWGEPFWWFEFMSLYMASCFT